MFLDKLKYLAVAAVISVAPLAASAATVMMNDGDIISPVNAADDYLYEALLEGTGGAGTRAFTFVVDALDSPLTVASAAAHLSLRGDITGAFLSWFDGVSTSTVALTEISLGNAGKAWTGGLSALFTSPDHLTQTVTIGWDSYRGPVQLSLAVAAVPVPAAGFLLFGALGGLAALRRRKAKAV